MEPGGQQDLPAGRGQLQVPALQPAAAVPGGSDTIALIEFSKDAVLGNRTTHILPGNSTYCVSIAFSPILSDTGNALLATANFYSDDVSISQIFGTSSTGGYSGDGSGSSPNIGIIVGPIIGGVGALTGAVVAGIVAYTVYKYFAQLPRGWFC